MDAYFATQAAGSSDANQAKCVLYSGTSTGTIYFTGTAKAALVYTYRSSGSYYGTDLCNVNTSLTWNGATYFTLYTNRYTASSFSNGWIEWILVLGV